MVDLLRKAGADIISVSEVESVEQPAAHAPAAPIVPNLPDPTPPPSVKPGNLYKAKLDTSALFLPNLAQFSTSKSRIIAQLQPIITAWRTGKYSHISVVGRCAMFGPAASARRLSLQRAYKVASLLRSRGVTAITAKGVGYDEPLPPNPRSASNRVVIVTVYPK
jgi:outer membrane protein OmpA-like peptidoglycan-associated protein